jgi:sialidase-1
MDKQRLFEARVGGYHNYRIPVLAVAPGGAVLAACEARGGRGGDWDANDILLRRSADHGGSFAEPITLVDHTDFGPGPANNLVLIADAEHDCVHGLFCHDYRRVFYIRSDDGGVTFGDPREITDTFAEFRAQYDWVVCATGPGHGIRLRSGRLVVPVWLSDGSWKEFGPHHRGHRPNLAATVYSDDAGATWRAGELITRPEAKASDGRVLGNCNEAALAELPDGRVMINMRNGSEADRRLISVSPDGASDWSTPWFDETLIAPACLGSLVAHPSGDLLFSNPANLENEMIPPDDLLRHDRKRLTVRLSRDGGRSWPAARVLEPGPAGYSHLAVLADNRVACFYEDGTTGRMCDTAALTLARFDRVWIEAGDGPPG